MALEGALHLAVCGLIEILPPEEPRDGVQATRPAAHMQIRKAEIQVSATSSITLFVDKIYYIQKLILSCRAGQHNWRFCIS